MPRVVRVYMMSRYDGALALQQLLEERNSQSREIGLPGLRFRLQSIFISTLPKLC
jgi:hypothetical protein